MNQRSRVGTTAWRLAALVAPLALLGVGPRTGGAQARGPEPAVRSSVQVSTDDPGVRHVESWLAINPRDPRNLIAASMVFGERGGVAAYASQDGGTNWARATHGANSDRVFEGLDPAVAFDPDGKAYLLTLSKDVTVWSSTDNGRSWGEPVVVAGSGDRPFIGCDRSGREGLRGRTYVSGKRSITVFGHRPADWYPDFDVISLATSRDGGATFGFPRLFLPAPELEILNVGSDLLVAPDGRLILALQTFPPTLEAPPSPLSGWYSTIVSEDGGRTFSDPRRIAEFRTFGHAREGKSLLGLGGGRLAMDTSTGPTRGRLYFAWLDVVDGFYQVMVAASADGGRSWSRPLRVNDNTETIDQSNPAIAIDGNGVVGVSWNDRRGDPSDRCYQLFFAASGDGAATFSPNLRADGRFTCPIGTPGGPPEGAAPKPDPSVDPVTSEYRFKNGGDTQGIVGLPERRVPPGVDQRGVRRDAALVDRCRGGWSARDETRPQPTMIPGKTSGQFPACRSLSWRGGRSAATRSGKQPSHQPGGWASLRRPVDCHARSAAGPAVTGARRQALGVRREGTRRRTRGGPRGRRRVLPVVVIARRTERSEDRRAIPNPTARPSVAWRARDCHARPAAGLAMTGWAREDLRSLTSAGAVAPQAVGR